MNLLVLVIGFLYVYDIKFINFPTFSTAKIVIIIFFLFCGRKKMNKLLKLSKNKEIFYINLLYLFIVIYSLMLPTILKTYDFELFKTNLISILEVFLGSFFIMNLIKKQTKLNSYEIISIISFFQATVVIVFYIFPEFRNYIFDNFIMFSLRSHFDIENKFFNRGVGLTGAGAIFSVVQFIGAYCSILNLDRKKYKVFLIFQLSSVVLLGRTGIMCYILGILMLFIFSFFQREIKKVFYENIKFFLKIVIISIVLYVFFLQNISTVTRLFQHSFELFINLFKHNSFKTASTDNLIKDMIFLPKNLNTYLIGDGRTNDIILGNYMGTDSGYLETLFFGGILFFIIYYLLKIRIIRNIFNYSIGKKEKTWILILGIILFICEIKEPMLKNFTLNKMLFLIFWDYTLELEKYKGVRSARKNDD